MPPGPPDYDQYLLYPRSAISLQYFHQLWWIWMQTLPLQSHCTALKTHPSYIWSAWTICPPLHPISSTLLSQHNYFEHNRHVHHDSLYIILLFIYEFSFAYSDLTKFMGDGLSQQCDKINYANNWIFPLRPKLIDFVSLILYNFNNNFNRNE